MNSFLKYLACLLIFPCLVLVAGAKEIDLGNGGISFNAPDDFTSLTRDEIATKFPRRTGPLEAVGNNLRDVTISYCITSTAVRTDQLEDFKKAMTSLLPRLMPGLQILKNDFVEINGTKWIEIESVVTEGNQNIHNIQLITSYHSQMLAFNFNSTATLFDAYQNRLRASLNTIQVKDNPQ